MTEPRVLCVMLVNGRPKMTRRAIASFRAQTYSNKRLYVYDSGAIPVIDAFLDGLPENDIVYHGGLNDDLTIGELRNRANWWGVRPSSTSEPDCDIIAHFDSDDWSGPQRLSEQVALLQSSGKQAVGYRDCLFWREPASFIVGDGTPGERSGEAWLYSNNDPRYILGTSLCYWRKTWEAKHFDERPNDRQNNPLGVGEDKTFIRDLDCLGVSSLECSRCLGGRDNTLPHCPFCGLKYNPLRPVPVIDTPRMIASIHGGNSSGAYDFEDLLKRGTTNWKRVPEWDAYCREKMSL